MYGPFRRDHTMILLPVLFLIGALVYWASGRFGVALAGYIFIAAEVIFAWYVVFGFPYEERHNNRLAVYSRKALNTSDRALGHNRHLSTLEGGNTKNKKSTDNVIKKLGRVDVKHYEVRNGLMGILRDRRYKTYNATLDCQFSSFILDDEETLQRRMKAWAILHDRLSSPGSKIERVSFRVQTFYREPRNALQTLAAIRRGAGLNRYNAPNETVLLRRFEELGEDSVFHRATMTIAISAPKQKEAAKSLEGGLEELLAMEVQSFLAIALGNEGGVSPIGLKSAPVLTRNKLVLEKLLALDPIYGQPVWQRWGQSYDESQLLDASIATPAFADFQRDDYCQIGRTFHAGYITSEPEQRGVLPSHFWNLVKVPVPKIITCVYYGMPPKKALEGAELRRGSARGRNRELESRNIQLKSVQEVEAEEARTHEDELARNLGQVGRERCYIDLTAASVDELRANQLRLENARWDSRFVLTPLDGRPHLAPSAAMPLARGLALPHKGIMGWIDT